MNIGNKIKLDGTLVSNPFSRIEESGNCVMGRLNDLPKSNVESVAFFLSSQALHHIPGDNFSSFLFGTHF